MATYKSSVKRLVNSFSIKSKWSRSFSKIVKILATLKSPCALRCHLIQKLEPDIGRVNLRKCYDIKFHLSFKKFSVPYETGVSYRTLTQRIFHLPIIPNLHTLASFYFQTFGNM